MGAIEEKLMFRDNGFISNEENKPRPFKWILSNNVTGEYESDYDSCDSLESLSSNEMVYDETSSCNGPLYELSQLMEQLPIKRGLSKYYQGKSESFGSLANLENIKDLAKKGNHGSRSFRSNGNSQNQRLSPKGKIVKNKKSSLFSSFGEMSSLLDTFSVQNHF